MSEAAQAHPKFDAWWDDNKQAFLEGATAKSCAFVAFQGAKQSTPRPSEALYLFAAWITSMDDPPIGNPTEHPGDWAKLVETFCKHNNLEDPDCKYPGLSHPPKADV